jgi:hypothetical protein
VALGLATRPVVTLVLRGLEVLAVVFLLGVSADWTAATTRGLELPSVCVLVGAVSEGVCGGVVGLWRGRVTMYVFRHDLRVA